MNTESSGVKGWQITVTVLVLIVLIAIGVVVFRKGDTVAPTFDPQPLVSEEPNQSLINYPCDPTREKCV